MLTVSSAHSELAASSGLCVDLETTMLYQPTDGILHASGIYNVKMEDVLTEGVRFVIPTLGNVNFMQDL